MSVAVGQARQQGHEAAGRTAATAVKQRTDKGGWTGTPQDLSLVTHILQRDSPTVAQLSGLLKLGHPHSDNCTLSPEVKCVFTQPSSVICSR